MQGQFYKDQLYQYNLYISDDDDDLDDGGDDDLDDGDVDPNSVDGLMDRAIKEGIIDATLLAYAGLKRLGKDREIKQLIDTKVILPAVGQGALAATCRGDDAYANTILALLAEPTTTAAIVAERAMLAVLDGSCHTPIGGLAQPDGQGHLELRGLVALPNGAKTAEVTMTAPITKAEDLGKSVGENLLIKAGPDILNFLEEEKPLFVRPHPEAE